MKLTEKSGFKCNLDMKLTTHAYQRHCIREIIITSFKLPYTKIRTVFVPIYIMEIDSTKNGLAGLGFFVNVFDKFLFDHLF